MPLKELRPGTPDELAAALREAATRDRHIAIEGASSKIRMGGPRRAANVVIGTTALNRLLLYEPEDLTISVEAGMRYADLKRILAENRQMVPLDPPFAETATIGGILATNGSGPRRRLYGSARDLVIGMKFATLEGKIVQSGGMVVKNVAGLDMAKLMIGSFGTLAAIATVNFKLTPMPALERSFLLPFGTAAEAVAARDRILSSVLQPSAIDILSKWDSPLGRATASLETAGFTWNHLLAVQAGGNAAVVARYESEMRELGADCTVLEGEAQAGFWRSVGEFAARKNGCIVRVSCRLAQVRDVLESTSVPLLARAGSGVCYAAFDEPAAAFAWMEDADRKGYKAIMESAPESDKDSTNLWPSPGPGFETMTRVKQMFDPNRLLNRDRLYHRI